jgi:bacteriocin resistance YdeI/OmpD-like protein/uncharacterized protein DUF1905
MCLWRRDRQTGRTPIDSSKTFKTTIVRDGSTCFVPLTFDPKSVFGKVRVPVKVTLNGYTYRSTIAAMGGPPCVPLRRSHRMAAGLEGGEMVEVRVELDTEERVIEPPADFVKALKATSSWQRWRALSYTHQREYVESIEEAKTPETRARRIMRSADAIKLTPKRTGRLTPRSGGPNVRAR